MQNVVTTSLTFNRNAEEAIRFYVDIFNKAFGAAKPESKILKITYYGSKELGDLSKVPEVEKENLAGPAGSVKSIRFLLAGQEFTAVNGGGFFGKFHESISLYINCDNQQQIDILYDALATGGELQPCGWVKDRFGISWQVAPEFLWAMDEEDSDRSQEVMKALYKMNKIDEQKILNVWNGKEMVS